MGLKIFSEQFRNEVLKLNLKTPPDVVLGLVNLSGSALYSAYIDALGKDAVIKTDKTSVTVKDPGNILSDAINPRQKNLNKNLQTPSDVSIGLGNITQNQSITLQYLSGRGEDTEINDYNVINPGNIVDDSVNPRQKNLNRNLQTPPDIISNISSGYLGGLGEETYIGDSTVKNPGTVDDVANVQRTKLFNRNKPIDTSDPSESDPMFSYLSQGSYTYSSLLESIGNLTLINDLTIPNAISVSTQSNQTPEVLLQLQLQQNRYLPVEINQFESTVINLKPDPFSQPYVDAYNSGIFTYSAAQEYQPSSFLNLTTSINPLSIMTNTADPMSYLLNGGTPPLTNETLLMNIAALELKFNFETRIKRAIERETLGKTNLDEALTNPIAAANILRNPYGWFNLFERNYTISVPSSTVGKAAQFALDLAGVTNPINLEFALSTDDDLTPRCFGNQIEIGEDGATKNRFEKFVDSLLGRSATRKQDRDAYFIRRTGAGQRYSLFYSVGKNKYQPDYLSDSETTLFLGQEELQALRKLGGYFGIGAGERPEGNYYIGNKGRYDDPIYLLQDADGHQVKSNQAIVESLKKQNPNNLYEEPGYSGSDIDVGGFGRPQGVSEYGSLKTNFIWKSSVNKDFGLDTAYDFNTNQQSQQIQLNDIAQNSHVGTINENLLSVTKYNSNKFRECSILFTTSQLLNKGIQTEIGTFNSPIDQTITKFYDGYDFVSRANSTILPKKIDRINKEGEVIGYRYLVPGLDASGKRNDKEMYKEAELCRVWTKPRPYAKITDLVRYKELIRKERNSVIDRFGNYNIFPSELNVNTGYGRAGDGSTDAVVEYFGQKRARKYMFSIENLAWRDAWNDGSDGNRGKIDLPNCEKGPNGGRVMWFPPYEIQFTDNSTANWTTHQFLGRPEPVYTYNNSERSGTLSWKIVVDHPSMLNILTQKELARLTDGEVDELLSAFWAGCLEFDVFELARIWNQFSQSDIDYFKRVIRDLDLTKSNGTIKPRIESVFENSQPNNNENFDINVELPKSTVNGFNLFFENDVPLRPEIYNRNANNLSAIYDTGKIESYEILFNKYYNLTKGVDKTINAETTKNNYRSTDVDSDWINYDYTIGNKGDIDYMGIAQTDPIWYGMYAQYTAIENDLSNEKYVGFDLDITIEAHASPLGPDQNTSTYNDLLARRRFISVLKWLTTKVITNRNNLGKLYFDDDTEVTLTELENRLLELYNQSGVNTILFRRDNGKATGVKDDIRFTLTQAQAITAEDAIRAIYKEPLKVGPNNEIYYPVSAPKPGQNNKVIYYCFKTEQSSLDAITNNWLGNVPADQIGTIEAKAGRPYKDVVCGVLSVESSFARRVSVDIKVSKKPENPAKTEPAQQVTTITLPIDQQLNGRNVTKRDIAQRIINKMITECDYFELLRDNAPFVYDSLRQKLKYFQPAFHAITPEGLNARLTFLQQCLRPGDTIKRKVGEDFCDATNTAFGKPPICVLRIGDFYHTKIVIDNLNISYEPLVWDLNPEGIGAQPMIANVELSFKYIGGSGLRKHVDQLQNALSFNYYANTDVYDDRTFANTDQFERNLINLERSFFDNNTLDLIPIVASAERLVPADFQEDIPYGTIGVITKRRIPTTAGGLYSEDITRAQPYNPSTVYQISEIVSFNNKFYLRKSDDDSDPNSQNTLDGSSAPVNNKAYWEEISWRNYGEQAFRLEFNSVSKNPNNDDQFLDKTYFNWYEIQYMDLFKQMYETYGQIYQDNYKYNSILEPENTLLDLVLNKNYNKQLTITNSGDITTGITTGNTSSNSFLLDPLQDMSEFVYQDGMFNGLTGTTNNTGKYGLFKVFDEEAVERNYLEYSSFDILGKNVSEQLTNAKLSPLKLHLYPQNYLYKIGDGKTVVPNNGVYGENDGRFNPGSFTGGYDPINGLKTNAEVAGFYFKDYTNHANNIDAILRALRDEIIAKTKLDLNHFWFFSPSLFKEYTETFETPHKDIFRNYIADKFANYINDVSTNKTTLIRNLEENNAKLLTLINGISVVLDGYDLKKDQTTTSYYEVIPNDFKLSTDAKTLFGYEPYYEYKTLSFNNFEILNFTEVRDVIYDRELNNTNKLKFLSLGNGTYFFKQISRDNIIKQLSGNNYTFNNYLPESIAIRDYVSLSPDAQNFDVTTGLTLNTKIDKNGIIGGQTTTLSIQPTGSEDKTGSYQTNYGMQYTFEKLNYEFFEFSNKNLDIMLNDNYLKRDFDFDIVFNQTFDFLGQLLTSGGKDLFYFGSRSDLIKIPISYYTFNPNSFQNTPTQTIVNEINNFIDYYFTITKDFVENSPKPNLTNLINVDIKLSGLVDLLFLKVLSDLNDTDKAQILEKIKDPGNKPKKGIVGNDKTQEKQIAQKYVKMENILNKIFIEINSYVKRANNIINPLHKNYGQNELNVLKRMNKILVDDGSSSVYDAQFITNKLLKGGVSDYTVVVKDAVNIKSSVQNNHAVFTNTRSLFNINTQSEQPEIIEEPVETEFNKYLKYDVGASTN